MHSGFVLLYNEGIMYDLSCSDCGEVFTSKRPDKRYCSYRCQSRVGRRRRGEQSDITKAGRDCPQCGNHFDIAPPSTNQRYCSENCSRDAARNLRKLWMRRHPEKPKLYNASRPFKDSVIGRLRRKYPDLPISCQSCGEGRILEVAHKPGYKRNGAWRIVANTKPHMIWILCPTCHKLFDRGISTAEDLHLA